MKSKMTGCLLLVSSFSFISENTHAGMGDFYLPTFYVGADAQIRSMRFQQDFGHNLYKKFYPQGNFYFGIKGNEYLGIEVGFDTSRSREHAVFVPAGSTVLGITEPFDFRLKSIVKFRGFNVSLIGFFPFCSDPRFNLIAAAGLQNLKIRIENTVTAIGNSTEALGVTLCQSKNILRLMTGIQYMFTDYFGTRLNIRWENTAQLRNLEPVRLDSANTAKAKNSFIYGFGIFFQF